MGKARTSPGQKLFNDRREHLTPRLMAVLADRFGPGVLPANVDPKTGVGKPLLLGTGAYGYVVNTMTPGIVMKVTKDASEAFFVAGAHAVSQGWWPAGIPRHYCALEIACGIYAIWRDQVDSPGSTVHPGLLGGEQTKASNLLQSYLHVAFQIWANSLRDPALLGELDFKSIPRRLFDEALLLCASPDTKPWDNICDGDHERVRDAAIRWAQEVNQRDGGVAGYEAMLALLFRISAEIEDTAICRQLGHALAFFLRENVMIQDLHFGNIAWSSKDQCPVLFDVGRALLLGDLQDRVKIKKPHEATPDDWQTVRVTVV